MTDSYETIKNAVLDIINCTTINVKNKVSIR